MSKLLRSLVVLLSLLVGTTLFASDAKDKDEAIALVKKAVELINKDGDGALAVIGKTNGDFHKGELYAFVYDENVVMLAHPEKPSLVGRSFKGMPDVKGKKFRDDIVSTALNGGGWVDYAYQKPNESGIHNKSTYAQLATHNGKKYIVSAGIYID